MKTTLVHKGLIHRKALFYFFTFASEYNQSHATALYTCNLYYTAIPSYNVILWVIEIRWSSAYDYQIVIEIARNN